MRVTDNQKYIIDGILNKLLQYVINDTNSELITGFSDNRLNEELVYEKVDFKFNEEIQPDYFLTKGDRRYDKSLFNKIKNNSLDKSVIIEPEKLKEDRKIWDLGKKRWVYAVASPTN